MSLKPSPFSFSEQRLRAVWRDNQHSSRRGGYELQTLINHFSDQGLPNHQKTVILCLKLYDTAIDGFESHVRLLDDCYSDTYRLGPQKRVDEQQVLDKAAAILGQLPATSPSILGALPYQGPFAESFNVPDQDEILEPNTTPIGYAWERLLVVNFVDTIVLRFALARACKEIGGTHGDPIVVRVLNATMYLLRVSLDLKELKGDSQVWTIVCAFLWTSWQRILMLHLRSTVGSQLQGFDYNIHALSSVRFQDLLPELFEYRQKVQLAELQATPYLCGWAHRNLVEDRACISTDLRRFVQLYQGHFGSRLAICNSGATQCNGKSSINCGRFESTPATNQSMHTKQCPGFCQRLFWSRQSFVGISGPKAICIATSSASELEYCPATTKTLTISHVWSHGQGGRPDHGGGAEATGFNFCLHQRYMKIAMSLGCSSYWMDTPCIPSEEELRSDCIAQISPIFILSEVTLICDRDIMSIDVSDSTVEVYEALLAVLLVCDWNMRAWTLLEAMRGRSSLHILCFNDQILRLQDVLEKVYREGRVDILIPFASRPYLFSPSDITELELFEGYGSVASEEDYHDAKGFISIDEAAVLLSRRHATRDDDDVLIWNMLIGNPESQDIVEMWKQQVGKRIPTGTLLSSAPRLKGIPGLQWAPSRPTIARRSIGSIVSDNQNTFPPNESGNCVYGDLTTEGLRARWFAFKFKTVNIKHDADQQADSTTTRLLEITQLHLEGFPLGILLMVCSSGGPKNIPLFSRGSSGHVLVVCGSHHGKGWEWRGLHEWDRSCRLPKFCLEQILLI